MIYVIASLFFCIIGCSSESPVSSDPSPKVTASLCRLTENSESEFDIDLYALDEFTNNQINIFIKAARRWEEVVIGDIADVTFKEEFRYTSDVLNQEIIIEPKKVDDLVIYLGKVPDNENFAASASLSYWRSDSNLSVIGEIALTHTVLEKDYLYAAVLHEIGHILGIGNAWEPSGFDMIKCGEFTGFAANLVFDMMFPANTVRYVPVSSTLGHWTNEYMYGELMSETGTGSAIISKLTIAALSDFGYEVDINAADEFVPVQRSAKITHNESFHRH